MKEKFISCNGNNISGPGFKLPFSIKNGLKWRIKNRAYALISDYSTVVGGRIGSSNNDFQISKHMGLYAKSLFRNGNITSDNAFYISLFEPYTFIYHNGYCSAEYDGVEFYSTYIGIESLQNGINPAVGALNNNGTLIQFWNGEIYSVECIDSDGTTKLCDLHADYQDGAWGMRDDANGGIFYVSETDIPFGGGER